jgi:hypothetical protein
VQADYDDRMRIQWALGASSFRLPQHNSPRVAEKDSVAYFARS